VKALPMLSHAVRFDRKNPNICPGLVWKSQFTEEPTMDPLGQSTIDDQYWCVYTQACVGPDNGLVEPHLCSVNSRSCHRDAVRRSR
jgi:hypothetical protein